MHFVVYIVVWIASGPFTHQPSNIFKLYYCHVTSTKHMTWRQTVGVDHLPKLVKVCTGTQHNTFPASPLRQATSNIPDAHSCQTASHGLFIRYEGLTPRHTLHLRSCRLVILHRGASNRWRECANGWTNYCVRMPFCSPVTYQLILCSQNCDSP